MTDDLVILGCGGFGREVASVVTDINLSSSDDPVWHLVGFLDDSPSNEDRQRVERLGLEILGTLEDRLAALSGSWYVVAVGNGSHRETMSTKANRAGLRPAVLIHPTASIGSDVAIADGAIVCGGVSVTTNITIGKHVQINPNSNIGHDTYIDDFVTISPLVAISGNCRVGSHATLGASSTVLPGVSVGAGAVLGASACAIADVPIGATVVGVPARTLGPAASQS